MATDRAAYDDEAYMHRQSLRPTPTMSMTINELIAAGMCHAEEGSYAAE